MESQNNRACSNLSPTSLHNAAKDAHDFGVSVLVNFEGLNVNAQDDNGKTALMVAAESSHFSTVELLLRNNANVHLEDKTGKTVLHTVFASSQTPDANMAKPFLNVLKMECLDNNNQLAMKLLSVECPLNHAVYVNDVEVLRFMIEKGNCDVDARDPNTHMTALHHAIGQRDFKSAKLLIEHGADINALDSQLKIPAAYYDYSLVHNSSEELEVIQMFIERNALLTTRQRNGELQIQTLLHSGSSETLQLLLKSNVDWSATNAEGDSPLTYLASNDMLFENQDILEGFRDRIKIDSAFVSRHNRALVIASRNNISKLVEILLESGVDPNIKIYHGARVLNPLFAAVNGRTSSKIEKKKLEEQSRRTFVILLERCANPQTAYNSDVGNYRRLLSFIATERIHLAHLAMEQLAIDKSLGKAIIDPINDFIMVRLKDQFNVSKSRLDRFKSEIFFNKITFYDVLTADWKKLIVYRRNTEFCSLVEKYGNYCGRSLDSYYACVMQKKLQRVLRVIQFAKNITELVCEAMNVCYDSHYLIVNKITDYVIFQIEHI